MRFQLYPGFRQVAFRRKTRSVVVAIRGTMSLADLVTDAVVHPECLSGWMPVESRKVPFCPF